MTDENQEAVDNIEAQLDMAVEAADDIGFGDDASIQSSEIEAANEGDVTAEVDETVEQTASSSIGTQPEQQDARSDQDSSQVATGQNQRGDLTNSAGEVVAERGAERRVYERNERLSTENRDLQAKMADIESQFNDRNALANQPTQLGLNNEEAVVGMQLMQQLKSDPVAAARQILQTAVSKGYNIQDIIGTAHGAESPVNMGAIKQLISDQLAPITAREQAQQAETDRIQGVEQAKQQFISTHQYSDIHIDAITSLLQNNNNMSPDQAYFEVKSYAMSNNLDFTQPLLPQVQAKRVDPDPNYQGQPNRAMPNGNGSSNVVTQSPSIANGDDDWDAVVRTAMAESGMQF